MDAHPYLYGDPSPFPPSFEGNPFAYGFGLFGDLVAAALGLALLLTFMLEGRQRRAIVRALGQLPPPPIPRSRSALEIYRAKNICIMLFIVLRSMPDALWMLAWGEVSEPTIRALLALDLVCDGLALAPLLVSLICWAWARQVVEQRLITAELKAAGSLPWDVIWSNGKIVALVVVAATLVTLGKAAGA